MVIRFVAGAHGDGNAFGDLAGAGSRLLSATNGGA
jgi:hypothetical protein